MCDNAAINVSFFRTPLKTVYTDTCACNRKKTLILSLIQNVTNSFLG